MKDILFGIGFATIVLAICQTGLLMIFFGQELFNWGISKTDNADKYDACISENHDEMVLSSSSFDPIQYRCGLSPYIKII